MFTITHGEPSEQQVVVVCLAVTFLIAYPLLIAALAICGWLQNRAAADQPADREPAEPAAPVTRVGRWAEAAGDRTPAGSAV